MKKNVVAVAVGGVWLAAIASAVWLVYALDRPLAFPPGAYLSSHIKVLELRSERLPAEPESAVLVIPTLFIVASRPSTSASPGQRGVAEMQKQDELIIEPAP